MMLREQIPLRLGYRSRRQKYRANRDFRKPVIRDRLRLGEPGHHNDAIQVPDRMVTEESGIEDTKLMVTRH